MDRKEDDGIQADMLRGYKDLIVTNWLTSDGDFKQSKTFPHDER